MTSQEGDEKVRERGKKRPRREASERQTTTPPLGGESGGRRGKGNQADGGGEGPESLSRKADLKRLQEGAQLYGDIAQYGVKAQTSAVNQQALGSTALADVESERKRYVRALQWQSDQELRTRLQRQQAQKSVARLEYQLEQAQQHRTATAGEDCKRQIEELRAQIEQHMENIQQLQFMLQESQDGVREKDAAIAELKEVIKEMTAQHAEEIEKRQRDIDERDLRINQLLANGREHSALVDELRGENDTALAELQRYRERCEEEKEELRRTIRDLEQTKGRKNDRNARYAAKSREKVLDIIAKQKELALSLGEEHDKFKLALDKYIAAMQMYPSQATEAIDIALSWRLFGEMALHDAADLNTKGSEQWRQSNPFTNNTTFATTARYIRRTAFQEFVTNPWEQMLNNETEFVRSLREFGNDSIYRELTSLASAYAEDVQRLIDQQQATLKQQKMPEFDAAGWTLAMDMLATATNLLRDPDKARARGTEGTDDYALWDTLTTQFYAMYLREKDRNGSIPLNVPEIIRAAVAAQVLRNVYAYRQEIASKYDFVTVVDIVREEVIRVMRAPVNPTAFYHLIYTSDAEQSIETARYLLFDPVYVLALPVASRRYDINREEWMPVLLKYAAQDYLLALMPPWSTVQLNADQLSLLVSEGGGGGTQQVREAREDREKGAENLQPLLGPPPPPQGQYFGNQNAPPGPGPGQLQYLPPTSQPSQAFGQYVQSNAYAPVEQGAIVLTNAQPYIGGFQPQAIIPGNVVYPVFQNVLPTAYPSSGGFVLTAPPQNPLQLTAGVGGGGPAFGPTQDAPSGGGNLVLFAQPNAPVTGDTSEKEKEEEEEEEEEAITKNVDELPQAPPLSTVAQVQGPGGGRQLALVNRADAAGEEAFTKNVGELPDAPPVRVDAPGKKTASQIVTRIFNKPTTSKKKNKEKGAERSANKKVSRFTASAGTELYAQIASQRKSPRSGPTTKRLSNDEKGRQTEVQLLLKGTKSYAQQTPLEKRSKGGLSS
jgi:hypothetical protein